MIQILFHNVRNQSLEYPQKKYFKLIKSFFINHKKIVLPKKKTKQHVYKIYNKKADIYQILLHKE